MIFRVDSYAIAKKLIHAFIDFVYNGSILMSLCIYGYWSKINLMETQLFLLSIVF